MIEKRLEELRREFRTGRELLERLDLERTQAQETLLRISGAIQVLEELTKDSENAAAA
jgi:septation ring formation regulator EzrA